ncbi:MAG TPA: hypothetical protein PLT63_11605, partial [Syntrophales bacterium]|nr:hypothetical protein [Syntrophales bacterium]
TAGMDDLDKKLAEIERDIAKMRANPNADLKLIDEIELQRQTAAIKAWYDEYLQEQIKAKENFDRQEKAKQDSIAKGAQETADAIQKQYDADGQLLRDKLELYKDLTGFEDEYRQVQLDWIERIKKEEIKATGDVAAAEKKAAKERAQIEYNLFKTKTDYIADGFGQLQSAFTEIAGVYEKGSDAARQWEQAAKAMEIAQRAVAVVQAVAAIATQGLGDPYTAFARVAAMAATMGALLASIGEGIGTGGGPSGSSAASTTETYTGQSTVLGAADGTASESIAKSWELLQDTYDMEYRELSGIYDEMKDLNSNITGLVGNIIRYGVTSSSWASVPGDTSLTDSGWLSANWLRNLGSSINDLFSNIPLIGNIVGGVLDKAIGWVSSISDWFVNGIFGGSSSSHVALSGITVSGGTIKDLIAGLNSSVNKYAYIVTHTSGGWFGHDTDTGVYQYAGVDEEVTSMFTKVFKNLSTTLVQLVAELGGDVQQALNYSFGSDMIELKDLSSDQINSTIQSYLSRISDNAAEALLGPLLSKYQQVNEGLFETAQRVLLNKAVVMDSLEMTGQAFTGTTAQVIEFSESIVDMAGDLDT